MAAMSSSSPCGLIGHEVTSSELLPLTTEPWIVVAVALVKIPPASAKRPIPTGAPLLSITADDWTVSAPFAA